MENSFIGFSSSKPSRVCLSVVIKNRLPVWYHVSELGGGCQCKHWLSHVAHCPGTQSQSNPKNGFSVHFIFVCRVNLNAFRHLRKISS